MVARPSVALGGQAADEPNPDRRRRVALARLSAEPPLDVELSTVSEAFRRLASKLVESPPDRRPAILDGYALSLPKPDDFLQAIALAPRDKPRRPPIRPAGSPRPRTSGDSARLPHGSGRGSSHRPGSWESPCRRDRQVSIRSGPCPPSLAWRTVAGRSSHDDPGPLALAVDCGRWPA